MRMLHGLLSVAVAACFISQAVASDRWTKLAEESERLTSTPSGRAWEHQMLSAHTQFWPDVYKECSAQAAESGIKRFSAIAVIDSSGMAKEFLISPDSPHLDCFSRSMVGRKYPAPPSAPFYELFKINLDSR